MFCSLTIRAAAPSSTWQVLDQRSRVELNWPLWVYGRRGQMARDLHWPTLEVSALRGDGERARLFGATRDRHWTDLIDPDLWLTDGKGGHWRCADAEVDDAGGVQWASAVNHLDPEYFTLGLEDEQEP